MRYDDDKQASPYESESCPKCGCELEVDYEGQQMVCPECEQEESLWAISSE